MVANIIVKCIIYNLNINHFLLVRRSDQDDIGADTWENAGENIESGETLEAETVLGKVISVSRIDKCKGASCIV